MTTPNIEELIEDLRLPFGLCPDEVVHAAADLLQSQAERIAELERESETHAKAYGLAIVERDNLRHELKTAQEGWRCECSTDDACRFARERDALRAQLAEIATTEPVATINDLGNARMFTLEANGYSRKDKLFTRPMPAQDVTLSLTDAEIAEVQASDPAYMTCSCMKFAWDILAAANAKGAK